MTLISIVIPCYNVQQWIDRCLPFKALLERANVFFLEHLAYEDNYLGSSVHLYVKDMYVLDKERYHYFINNNLTVTQRNALH